MRVGWYAHHQGAGHVTRALACAPHLPGLTVLSSAPKPAGAPVDWVRLPRDDRLAAVDPTAGGSLHWAPLREPGLRGRMARISRWIEEAAPDVLVCDVSVEVALLARLHGVPVVWVAQRGRRVDAPHRLAYECASAIVAPWTRGLHLAGRGLDADEVRFVGAIARPGAPRLAWAAGGDVLAVLGFGGSEIDGELIAAAATATAARTWNLCGPVRAAGPSNLVDRGVADPGPLISRCSVVVGSAGANLVAEVAAARRPFVCLPQSRPFGEQHDQAVALARLGVAEVVEGWPRPGRWPSLLSAAERRPLERWGELEDGGGARRLAAVVGESGSW